MDEFPGLLARDFGFRPQGKAAPMSAAKFSTAVSGSVRSPASRSGRSAGDSSLGGGGISGDHQSPDHFDDVFGGPSKPSVPHGRSSFDSLFDGLKDSAGSKPSSMPVYDKPVYDDDIFDGVPGIKSSSFANYEDVFASSSSASVSASSPPYDDLLQNLGRTMPGPKGSGDKRSGDQKESELSGFDDLIPGFGGSSPPPRIPSDTGQRTAAPSVKPTTSTAEDPFVVLETTTTPAYSSPGLFPDPLEHIGRPLSSRSTKASASPVSEGLIDENAFADLTKSVPFFTSDINGNTKDKPPLVTGNEPPQRSSIGTFESVMPKMQPTRSSGSLKSADRGGVQASDTNVATYERSPMEDQSPKSHEHLETADDVWLTVAEIPLFTQPTRSPPPSRPPPPVSIQQAQYGKMDEKKKDNDIFPQFSQSRPLMRTSVKKSGASSIDELEDFAAGKPQRNADEHAEVTPNGEEIDANTAAAASAAAMKAMDRAEAKFKQAREVRERELDAKSAKSREYTKQERDENAQDPDDNVNQERLDFEREQMEREEKVKEQKRLEKEREGLDRERGRHAVERATREARERAAADARQRAERAAVEKANAEARQRAERAAVQRAAAEARDRAAADARERAEKANAEARERAEKVNAEARERTAAEAQARDRAAAEARERVEKASAEARERSERVAAEARERSIAAREKAAAEARERAAVERAAAEARHRAQRAAVDRATAEARERASVEARERAAALAREKQHKADNDLESFFGMGNRANSAPKQRTTTSENVFDTQFQSKMASDGARRTSPGSSFTVRKTPSAANIVDDLTSIFGAPSSSGDFQEVEGESEERRRSRLERHQRTMERAAKALAEKNERDMQVQRDQAERHRIAEMLDIEINRWAAGKEGNLRALLSTLHYVLWPQCGWQAVSLTDLITGASVKKVYRRATLCIHPDKVQQKGSTLQQKYIAEKVFDLLKEAWNRFNSEELF